MANKWLTTAALAAGLVAIPATAQAESQWRLFGGISDVGDIEASFYGYDAEISSDTGFVIGAAYGVVTGNWVFEGELAHRGMDTGDISIGGYTLDVGGEASATSVMGNVWYNIPTGGNWGFYAGGGLGFAQVEGKIEGYSDDSTEFAWQLGGGVNMRTDAGFAYGIGYRYFNVAEFGIEDSGIDDIEVNAHEVIFEVSSKF